MCDFAPLLVPIVIALPHTKLLLVISSRLLNWLGSRGKKTVHNDIEAYI